MSASSYFISNITNFRNPNGPEQQWALGANRNFADPGSIFIAELAYIAIIPFAVVETALSAIAKLFSVCLPTSQERQERVSQWLGSSAFSIVWALADVIINPFCNDMIQTERVARACAASGNIFSVPREALV